jgi:hypothetical protein
MRLRKTTIWLGSIAALVLGAVIAWPSIEFFWMTGSFFPVRRIDSLQNPVAVTGWSPDGLRLADGRTVQLPGLRSLPTASEALAEATKRGVEIRSNGRVWGLVSVHHWCGNDAVREHLARVDLSDMLTFLHLGEPAAPVHDMEYTAEEPGGRFTEYGWNVSEFFMFQSWQINGDPTSR